LSDGKKEKFDEWKFWLGDGGLIRDFPTVEIHVEIDREIKNQKKPIKIRIKQERK
jgi:hypothetical protein